MTIRLARIVVFPVKSLGGVAVEQARVLPSGALEHDRRLALVDGEGRFLNGKRTPRVHHLSATVDWRRRHICFTWRPDGATAEFSLDDDHAAGAAWLSARLGEPARWLENAAAGFPDDTDSPGPTVVTAATLAAVAGWFPDLAEDELRRRFRANLEFEGAPAFWEDRLYGPAGQGVRFRIGAVELLGVNPCQRCVVPSRNTETGEATPGFARQFSVGRAAALPAWAEPSRFDHFYRLATNTRPPANFAGGEIAVGDEVTLVDFPHNPTAAFDGKSYKPR